MPDESKSNTPPGGSAGTAPSIHQAVMDLCIARRTLLIYPSSHDQVKRSLQRAYRSLSGILDSESNITLTVMKDGLAANDRVLDAKNTAFADLAAVLKQYQIAALTLSKGLGANELVRFLRLVTADRDKTAARGGIAAVAGEVRLDHVTVRAVDYSKLQITEESQVQRSSRRESDGSQWQAFVTDLLAQEDQALPGGKTLHGINPHPDKLAALLNRRKLKTETAIAHYERAMAEAAEAPTASSSGMSEGLQLFQQMIKELNPELQKQFLASTFDRCAQSLDASETTQLVDGLGADLIIRMLHQANSDGKRISPSLVAFINKVGYLARPGAAGGAGGDGDAGPSPGLTMSKVESLLAHEQYDTYVDSEYSRLLNDLTIQEHAAEQGWSADIAAELTDAHICIHAARAMTSMMTASRDAAGYRDWARQLAYLLDDLLVIRAFDFLIELMDFIRAEKSGSDRQQSEIAGLLLSRFGDTQFVAKAIQAVRETGKDPSPDALRFLTALGEPVVLEIFDSMDPALILDEEGDIIHILKSLSSLATREALERLNDPRPEYVVQMIRVVRKMGDGESAQPVRSALDHSDPGIRVEALATLLKFNNKWGLVRLRELLQQPTAPDFRSALDLAGEYGVREVVPQLLSFLEQRGDLDLREATLRALGRIGDSRAIPALTRLAHRRWGLSRKQIDRLKRVLYDTLGGYPYGEVKHLLHYGLKEKEAGIQAACRNLLREGTREGAEHRS